MNQVILHRTKAGKPSRVHFLADHRGEERRALEIAGARGGMGKPVSFPADVDVVRALLEEFGADNLQLDGDLQAWYSGAGDRAHDALAAAMGPRPTLPLIYGDKLYDYQAIGAQWLHTIRRGILADEPGLGKTIQALAACDLVPRRRNGKGQRLKQRVLIVTLGGPVALQWLRHCEEWLGAECALAIGYAYQRRAALAQKARFTVVTHSMLAQTRTKTTIKDGRKESEEVPTQYASTIFGTHWDVVIVDEGHRLQGRHAKQSRGARRLNADNVFILTGTPIWNMPDSLWHLLHILDPKRFSAYWPFVNQYCKVLEMPWGRQIKGINKARKVDLQRILAPMLLRRETDILGDQLPPVRFELIEYDLAGDHREAYDKARKELLLNWETVQKNYVSVAAAASDLRLLVAAPRCLDIAVDSPKDEIIERLVDDHLKNDHQLVVYGWHKKYVAHLIAKLQKTFGSPVVAGASALDSPAARMRAVDEFKKGARRVLVTSIGISGTGTDLPNARAVIFGEGDWTPAVIEQAWKRIHRIGQKHSSVVYFPVARRTIESDIYRTYVQKTAMAESILMLDAVRRALFEEG